MTTDALSSSISVEIPIASDQRLPTPLPTQDTGQALEPANLVCAKSTARVKDDAPSQGQAATKTIASSVKSKSEKSSAVHRVEVDNKTTADAEHVKPKLAGKRTAKGGKATKADLKSSNSLVVDAEDVEDSFIAGLKTSKNPKRQKKVKGDAEGQKAADAQVQELPLASKPMEKGNKPISRKKKQVPVTDTPAVEPEAELEALQPAGTDNDEPRTSSNADLAATEPVQTTGAKKQVRARKKVFNNDTIDAPEQVLEQATTRPRRQAAKSAVEKVAMGFVEEAGSVDKLRRAPEPTKPAVRGRKRVAAPEIEAAESVGAVSAAATSRTKPDMDSDFAPKRKGRKKMDAPVADPIAATPKRSASEAIEILAPAEEALPAQSPKKRKREDADDELTAAVEQPKAKRGRKAAPAVRSKIGPKSRQKAVMSEPAPPEAALHMAALDGTTDIAGTPPKKRSRKTPALSKAQASTEDVSSCATARLDTIEEVSEGHHSHGIQEEAVSDEYAQRATANPLTTAPKTAKARKKPTKLSSVADETLLLFTPKKRRPLAETDANRSSLSPGKADRAKNDVNPPKKRKKTAQPDLQPTAPKEIEEPTKSKARSKEDIDWLFSASPPKKLPPKPQRKQGKKKTRLRFADRACKDMDLDDLLESVAAF